DFLAPFIVPCHGSQPDKILRGHRIWIGCSVILCRMGAQHQIGSIIGGEIISAPLCLHVVRIQCRPPIERAPPVTSLPRFLQSRSNQVSKSGSKGLETPPFPPARNLQAVFLWSYSVR